MSPINRCVYNYRLAIARHRVEEYIQETSHAGPMESPMNLHYTCNSLGKVNLCTVCYTRTQNIDVVIKD